MVFKFNLGSTSEILNVRFLPFAVIMLLKVKLGECQKFVRLTEPTLNGFFIAGKVYNVKRVYCILF